MTSPPDLASPSGPEPAPAADPSPRRPDRIVYYTLGRRLEADPWMILSQCCTYEEAEKRAVDGRFYWPHYIIAEERTTVITRDVARYRDGVLV